MSPCAAQINYFINTSASVIKEKRKKGGGRKRKKEKRANRFRRQLSPFATTTNLSTCEFLARAGRPIARRIYKMAEFGFYYSRYLRKPVFAFVSYG